MQATLDREQARLDLRFASRESCDAFFARAEQESGFVVTLPQSLDREERLRCRIGGFAEKELEVPVEVVHVFARGDAFDVAFRVAGAPRAPAPDGGDGVAQADHAAERSPIHRIQKLNPNQRFVLAMRASRIERQILLRDTSPQVLSGLLNHPRLEDKEVLELVKSTYANGAILRRVSQSTKWMKNPEIRSHVVVSPKTPLRSALKHLPTLRTSELRVLAKRNNAREALRKAALREYLGRLRK